MIHGLVLGNYFIRFSVKYVYICVMLWKPRTASCDLFHVDPDRQSFDVLFDAEEKEGGGQRSQHGTEGGGWDPNLCAHVVGLFA